MIGFLIKKTFFDGWDNLFRLALVNLGFVLSATIPTLIPGALAEQPAIALPIMVIGVLWCAVYLCATALSVKEISDYGYFGFKDFFKNIKAALPLGLFMGIALFLIGLFIYVALPFYLSFKSLLGLFAAAVVFWTIVVILLAFQYLPAIRARLDTDLRKVIKKSFIIFFDNPGLSIFAFFYNTITLILSFFLAFLIPGPAGMLLFLDEALRLRLYKYDWIEAHPEANRKHIPWEELMAEDRERTGTRSLRNFIFPWKD